MRRGLCSGALVLLTGMATILPGAFAQDDMSGGAVPDLGELNLEGLLRLKVVTASGGVAEESDLAPANVFTILGSEIVNQGWRSVAEVLAYVPGMYVVDDYVIQNIGVRGASGGLRAGSRIIKVMINGADISFRPDSNALIGPEFIPIEMVERIEIARGPLSALYGANAFLATVNIITYDPDRPAAGRVSLNGTGRQADGGMRYGGAGSAVVMSKLNERVKLQLGASLDRTDRGGLTLNQTFETQPDNTNIQPFLGKTSGRDLARPISLFGRAMFDAHRGGQIMAQGGLQQSDANGNFQFGSILNGQTREVIRNLWSDVQYQNKFFNERAFLNASLGYSQGAPTSDDRLYVTQPMGLPPNGYYLRKFNYNAVDGKVAGTWQILPSWRVSTGVDVNRETHRKLYYTQHLLVDQGANVAGDEVDSSLIGDTEDRYVHITKIAPNLHTTFNPISKLRISADYRADIINLFPTQHSWRGAVGWRILPNLVVKVIGGHAFQTPSTVFLNAYSGFGQSGDFQGAKNVRTAPPLVPQVIQSGELVINYVRGDSLSVNVAGYLQSIDHQIALRSLGPVLYPINQGLATSYGGELNLTYRIWHLEPYVRVSKQWFKTNPVRTDTDTGPDVPPALIPSYWALVGLRATVPNPHLTFDATYRQVGQRGATQSNIFLNSGNSYALPSYGQLDIAATATFGMLGKNRESRLTLVGHNLLNKAHFEPGNGGIDIPTMGRTVQLMLSQGL